MSKTTKAKQPKAEEPAKREPEKLMIDGRYIRDGEIEKVKGAGDEAIAAFSDKLTARALSQPEVRAARTIQRFEGNSLDINACADELRELVAEVQASGMKRPEAMLVAQAHTLDALFSSLALRSHANSREGYLDPADRYMRLALKAQSQAVRTLEALGELKNPRPVTFVRQANVAHNQQVNNGMPSQAGNFENQQNKLSGETYELLPDSRASGYEGAVNPAVATLEAIDRAAN
jgi:hypothetical protein